MFILGVDYHPSFQQIAFLNQETGECGEQRLEHGDGQAEKFYRRLQSQGVHVRVGMTEPGFCTGFTKRVYITAVGCDVLHDCEIAGQKPSAHSAKNLTLKKT